MTTLESKDTETTGRRVLVVDDNQDAAEVLADGLEMMGHRVKVAFDGCSAIALAADFRPEVAFLDLGLPVMDGFELARRLQALPELKDTQLVALTGYGHDTDRQRTHAAGFHAHLVKPIELLHLDAFLRGEPARH